MRGRGGSGGEWKEGGVGREGMDMDFAEAGSGGGVNVGKWEGFCLRGKEFESEGFYYETNKGAWIHCSSGLEEQLVE